VRPCRIRPVPVRLLGLANPQTGKLNRVLLVLTVALVALAAVNAILISWATVLDTRHPSALTRALGATRGTGHRRTGGGAGTPALAGALLGIPGGIELFATVSKDGTVTAPPAWWLIATVLGTVAAVVAVTAVPAWLGTRHSISGVCKQNWRDVWISPQHKPLNALRILRAPAQKAGSGRSG